MLYLHCSNGDDFGSFLLCFFVPLGVALHDLSYQVTIFHYSLVVLGIIFQDGKDVGQTYGTECNYGDAINPV